MTEDKKIFIDTNILIYSYFDFSKWNKVAIKKLRHFETKDIAFWISRQIIREYLVTATRINKKHKKEPLHNIDPIRFFSQFKIADENQLVTDQLISLVSEYKISGKLIHDANIVATMLVNNIPLILTHNIGDFARFKKIITVVPLLAAI